MPDARPFALCDVSARCVTCGFIGTVSLKVSAAGARSFECRGYGYVVPCVDFNAHGDRVAAYASPWTLNDLPSNIVPCSGVEQTRSFAWACLACAGTVTATLWVADRPAGGVLVDPLGICERCGKVARVSEAYDPAPRFEPPKHVP